ncbi:MAG: ATP-binding cassette domain-containing protein, partial [Bacteroidetes bacterium]|nr:ATP-binding cassette domain-containing protein [Bacteroidota bacterium]
MGALKLRTRGLTKRFKKRTVVDDVSLEVQCGEVVGLLGPNGAGKSTSFHMIVGLEKPNRGRIYLGKDDITALPMYQRARRGLGYLAQETSVFQQLTVEQNLHAVLEFQKFSRKERGLRVDKLISQFGLETVRTAKAYTLSGGERRRTEIARSMALEPDFFLLDEP